MSEPEPPEEESDSSFRWMMLIVALAGGAAVWQLGYVGLLLVAVGLAPLWMSWAATDAGEGATAEPLMDLAARHGLDVQFEGPWRVCEGSIAGMPVRIGTCSTEASMEVGFGATDLTVRPSCEHAWLPSRRFHPDLEVTGAAAISVSALTDTEWVDLVSGSAHGMVVADGTIKQVRDVGARQHLESALVGPVLRLAGALRDINTHLDHALEARLRRSSADDLRVAVLLEALGVDHEAVKPWLGRTDLPPSTTAMITWIRGDRPQALRLAASPSMPVAWCAWFAERAGDEALPLWMARAPAAELLDHLGSLRHLGGEFSLAALQAFVARMEREGAGELWSTRGLSIVAHLAPQGPEATVGLARLLGMGTAWAPAVSLELQQRDGLEVLGAIHKARERGVSSAGDGLLEMVAAEIRDGYHEQRGGVTLAESPSGRLSEAAQAGRLSEK